MARSGRQAELSARQRRGLAALLTAPNAAAAAQLAGVGERTMYRWLSAPHFQAALMSAEVEALDAATRQLTALASEAVAALRSTLADPATTAPVRVRAADVVLAQLMRLREIRDVEQRLAVLEAAWQTKVGVGNG